MSLFILRHCLFNVIAYLMSLLFNLIVSNVIVYLMSLFIYCHCLFNVIVYLTSLFI